MQALLEENASPPSDVKVSRGLVGERTPELVALDAKAGSAPPLLEERRRGNGAAVATAVAEVRGSAMERKAEEAGKG